MTFQNGSLIASADAVWPCDVFRVDRMAIYPNSFECGPWGGGWVRVLDLSSGWRAFDPSECSLEPCEFGFDEHYAGEGYHGLTDRRRWNGWAMPWFPESEALRVLADMSEGPHGCRWRVNDDGRYAYAWKGEDPEEWSEFPTRPGPDGQTLHGIGAGDWCWNEIPPEDVREVAS